MCAPSVHFGITSEIHLKKAGEDANDTISAVHMAAIPQYVAQSPAKAAYIQDQTETYRRRVDAL